MHNRASPHSCGLMRQWHGATTQEVKEIMELAEERGIREGVTCLGDVAQQQDDKFVSAFWGLM